MNAWKPILILLALLCALPQALEAAKVKKKKAHAKKKSSSIGCVNRVNGEWAYGRAPFAFEMGSAAEQSATINKYRELVFDTRNKVKSEEQEYVPEMHAYLRDSADYYLSQRSNKVDDAERNALRRALLAMVHQESYWSHYRIG